MFIDIVIPPDIAKQISNTSLTVISYKISDGLFAGQIQDSTTGLKLLNVIAKSNSIEDVQKTLHALLRTARDFMASSKWDGGHLHIVIESQKLSVTKALNLKTTCTEISVVEALKLSGAITPHDDEQA